MIRPKRVFQHWGIDLDDHGITIRDAAGKTVYPVKDACARTEGRRSDRMSPTSVMKTLFDLARRNALHADEALTDLLSCF